MRFVAKMLIYCDVSYRYFRRKQYGNPYMAGGRQFVVIATSGQRDAKGPQGTAYVAYALEN